MFKIGTKGKEIRKVLDTHTAKTHFGEVLDLVHYKQEHFLITKRKKPVAIIIPVEEYEELIDTLAEEMDPEFQHQLKESEKDYLSGKVKTLEELRSSLKRG